MNKKKVLEKVINHFRTNPLELRSVSNNGINCSYSPPEGKPLSIGCAVGMFMTKKQKELCIKENKNQDCVSDIIRTHLFPKKLIGLDLNFLSDIQSFHDFGNNWTDTDITRIGASNIVSMCNFNNINFNLLKLDKPFPVFD